MAAHHLYDDVVVSPFSSAGYANDWEWIGGMNSYQPEVAVGEHGDVWEQPTSNASTSPSCFHSSISTIASDTSLDLLVARTTIRVHPDPFLSPNVDPDLPSIPTIRRRSFHLVVYLDPKLLSHISDEGDCAPPDAPLHPAARTVVVLETAKPKLSFKLNGKFYYPQCLSKRTPICRKMCKAHLDFGTGRPPLCPFSPAVVLAYNADSTRLALRDYSHYTSGKGGVFRRVLKRNPTPTNPDTTFTIMTALPLTLCTRNRIYPNDAQCYRVASLRHAARMKKATTLQDQLAALRAFWRQIGSLHVYHPPPPRPAPLCFTLPVIESNDEEEDVSVNEQGATSVDDEATSSSCASSMKVANNSGMCDEPNNKATPDVVVNLQSRG